MSRKATERTSPGDPISYEESKSLARDPDTAVRAELASREDVRPEVLYFLAEDCAPEVRHALARNRGTPPQADLILAQDTQDEVRVELASKVANLTPDFDPQSRERATRYVIETLELLARDEAARVRRRVAEGLKSLTNAPPEVIRQLAEDLEDDIACMVLEASPLLDDEEILGIVERGCGTPRLKAISRRPGLGADIADAVVATENEAAITALLDNKSAQIREATLDLLIEQAPRRRTWHRPLVERPQLSLTSIRKLAGFVSETLLESLRERPELDPETAAEIVELVESRFGNSDEIDTLPAQKAADLHRAGQLDQETLSHAVNAGDHALVKHGLALLSGTSIDLVEEVFKSRSPKAITAMAWKSGCSMRFSVQLQKDIARIAPDSVLYARDGLDFPLSEEEMAWQFEFFQNTTDEGSKRPS